MIKTLKIHPVKFHHDLTQIKKGTLCPFCPFTGHMKVSQGDSVGLNLKQLTLIL